MKLLKSALLATSVIAVSAQAITVLEPTEVLSDCGCLENQTVNIIGNFNAEDYAIYLFGDELADSTELTVSDGLAIGAMASVDISEEGLATNFFTSETVSLNLDDKFFLGLYEVATGEFLLDTGIVNYGTDISTLTFSNGITTYAVDVQEVPVPAAAWLFGSAMLGLAGVSRRN